MDDKQSTPTINHEPGQGRPQQISPEDAVFVSEIFPIIALLIEAGWLSEKRAWDLLEEIRTNRKSPPIPAILQALKEIAANARNHIEQEQKRLDRCARDG